MLQLLVAVLVATVFIVESEGVCPPDPPGVKWACAYQPTCLGDGSCETGQKCCPHVCGARCATVVHCDPVHCGSVKCTFGFKLDHRGCKTCTCRTTKPCTTLLCKMINPVG